MADIHPVGRGEALHAGQTPDLRQLAHQLKSRIDNFNDLIPPTTDQLSDFANATRKLDDTSRQALMQTKKPVNALMEDVQNSAQTAQTIITQPLHIQGASTNVSLISAAVSYKPDDGKDSDLYKVSRSFMQYPEQVSNLKTELSLSSQDLSAY